MRIAEELDRTSAWPKVQGLPLAGSALNLGGDLRAFLTEQYLRLGPVFEVRAFNNTFIVLAGVEANMLLQRDGGTNLRSREVWQDFLTEFGASNAVLSLDGPEHQRLRQVMRDGYSRARIEERIPEVIELTRREIREWPDGKPIPVFYTMQRMATEVIGTVAAGASPREYLDDLIVYVKFLLLTRVTKRLPGALMSAPRVRRAYRRIEALIQEVEAVHQPEKRNGHDPDLIDSLLAEHKSDPRFLPETDMLMSLMGPFVVGMDTVAGTCAFMLYTMLKRPDIMELAKADAEAIFANGTPTAQDVRGMSNLHAIAMETLRMYPIATAITRTVSNSFEFQGYAISSGARVMIATTVPHYLPEYFPNPERFDIERYNSERREHTQPGVFAPFGLGPHSCLGNGFAQTQIALTLATMVHGADLALAPPGYELKLDYSPMPKPNKKFKFKVTGRR